MTEYEKWLASLGGGLGVSSSGSTSGFEGRVYVGSGGGYSGGKPFAADKTVSVTDKINEFYQWTPAQYNAFVNKLRAQKYIGKSEKVDPSKVASLWTTAVNEASKYYSATGGKNKMTVDGILSWYSKGNVDADAVANEPTRQIYQYKKEDIYAVINNVYESTLGRKPTQAELDSQYAPLEKQINQGTVTTTKKSVKNAKTGKLETVVTQTPGFSADAAKLTIEESLKKTNPDDFDRKKRIDFADWLSKNAAGA